MMLTGGMRDPLSSAVIGSLGAVVEDFVDGDFADVGFAVDAAGADAADFVVVFAAAFAADFAAGFAAGFAAAFVSAFADGVFATAFAVNAGFVVLFADVFAADVVTVLADDAAGFADASTRS
ncbi:hypothetical protein EMO89_10135 [Bifidobacterium tissieri]|uniref:Uncharacterized protein n=2 Tax=Bifidobacterium tissieri TaxID=1630162 RepID=A0A5M9ZJ22_9BIFI|nr:hypothetical protein EMO89_10135 [Bifidobacterium tissieri]